MSPDHSVSFTSGSPETILDPPDQSLSDLLAAARTLPATAQKAAVAEVAARDPRYLAAWATLAELADNPIERYAYARVGYHRGLDALRAAGWRGSGYVRWSHRENRGFLLSLQALAHAAAAIGETTESDRCAVFLRQLDPDGDPER